ncbi:MAG: hypothetical protein R3A13_04115 [Bdellovibrionota bacterium]
MANLGYETTVNLMGITNYSDAEISSLPELINEFKDDIAYFYLADSFGSLIPSRTKEIFGELRLHTDAPLGFHPHNNLQLAFANALEAIEAGATIVDGSIYGMGRGGGNLNLEALVVFLEQACPGKYNPLPILDFAEIYMEPIKKHYTWGYSLPNVISGALACHPNYPKEMLKLKSYSAKEVFNFLKAIPNEEKGQFSLKKSVDSVYDYQTNRSQNFSTKTSEGVQALVKSSGNKVLLVCGGGSVRRMHLEIDEFIHRNKCVVVAVNNLCSPFRTDAVFFGNARRLTQYYAKAIERFEVILNPYVEIDSSLDIEADNFTRVSLNAFLTEGLAREFPQRLPTNSGVEAILVMAELGFKEIFVVGMDGFSTGNADLYFYHEEDLLLKEDEHQLLNQSAVVELGVASEILGKKSASFKIITPTVYEEYFSSLSVVE